MIPYVKSGETSAVLTRLQSNAQSPTTQGNVKESVGSSVYVCKR